MKRPFKDIRPFGPFLQSNYSQIAQPRTSDIRIDTDNPCIALVDTIDDSLINLFRAQEKYEAGMEQDIESLIDNAIFTLDIQKERIDDLWKQAIAAGVPNDILTRENIEELKDDIEIIKRKMDTRVDHFTTGEDISEIDGKWTVFMWEKYCECKERINL